MKASYKDGVLTMSEMTSDNLATVIVGLMYADTDRLLIAQVFNSLTNYPYSGNEHLMAVMDMAFSGKDSVCIEDDFDEYWQSVKTDDVESVLSSDKVKYLLHGVMIAGASLGLSVKECEATCEKTKARIKRNILIGTSKPVKPTLSDRILDELSVKDMLEDSLLDELRETEAVSKEDFHNTLRELKENGRITQNGSIFHRVATGEWK